MRKKRIPISKHGIDRQIREKQELLDAVFQGIGDLVFITDTRRRITFANRAAIRISGYEKDEILGLSIFDLCMELSPDESKNATSARSFLKTASGPTIPVELTVSPLEDKNGGLFGYVYVIRDISERIRQEQNLRSTKEAVERSFKTRSEFLETMSCELQSALNDILRTADLALELLGNEEEAAEKLRILRQSGQNLIMLINSMLEYSSIARRPAAIREGVFSLQDLLEETVVLLAEASKEKGLEIHVHVEPSCAGLYRGDKTRIEQVVENLVGNGIKFTERGTIVIHTKDETENPGRTRDIHISVKDSGIGIPEDRLEDIFDAIKAGNSYPHSCGESGFGLAIVKQAVESMGGRVWVLSHLGSGSEFHVFLPLDAEDGKPVGAVLPDNVSIVIASGNSLRQRNLHDICLILGIPASRILILPPSRIEELSAIMKQDCKIVCLLDAEHQESARAVLVDTEAGEPREEWERILRRVVIVLRTKMEKPLLWKELGYRGLAISFPFRKDDLADAVKNACAFLGKTENGFGPPEKPDGTGSESLERNRMGASAPCGRRPPEMLYQCLYRVD